ncbi:hypothetical protein E3N86_00840 [Cryobacterium sp. Hz7]|uniref:hypothetical protein n=1 Tax=Cryobacterium sp. Hz7 TaxID=1259166 RepID=UPI001069A711|nr:hypothetical protein [Cryobacterium sp. Hz7]TFB66942.1 hypothetical protein E3N86_00840 [Cryobacterium sp. Hz7]
MTTYDRAAASDVGDLSAAELADVCEALIAAWHQDAALSATAAAPGSAAALNELSIRKAFPQGMPLNLEYADGQMAGQMVNAIILQLQSVVTLLRANPMVPLGLWPLVRSELEYAGRVAWLLEPLPGEEAGARRAARAMLEHLAALHRQRFTAGKWDKPRAKQFKDKRDALLRRIDGLFDDVHTPMENPQQIDEWRIGSETMLPLGKAVSLFLDLNLTNGAALYDVLSDNSHPSVISLAFQSTASDVDGVTSTIYPAIPRVINFQVRLGCITAYKSALTLLTYFGFPTSRLDQWAEAAPSEWFESSTP